MARFVGIDPSTQTGFVALDEHGKVVRAKELTGVGSQDPRRMVTLIDEIMAHLGPDDVVCIESPAMHAQGRAVGFMWGLAHGVRTAMFRRGWKYIDVSPSQVKKFATGKGNAKKDDMVLPIYKRWGFEHPSDNVRDAFVLAHIARAVNDAEYSDSLKVETLGELSDRYPPYQLEVINAILDSAK